MLSSSCSYVTNSLSQMNVNNKHAETLKNCDTNSWDTLLCTFLAFVIINAGFNLFDNSK